MVVVLSNYILYKIFVRVHNKKRLFTNSPSSNIANNKFHGFYTARIIYENPIFTEEEEGTEASMETTRCTLL